MDDDVCVRRRMNGPIWLTFPGEKPLSERVDCAGNCNQFFNLFSEACQTKRELCVRAGYNFRDPFFGRFVKVFHRLVYTSAREWNSVAVELPLTPSKVFCSVVCISCMLAMYSHSRTCYTQIYRRTASSVAPNALTGSTLEFATRQLPVSCTCVMYMRTHIGSLAWLSSESRSCFYIFRYSGFTKNAWCLCKIFLFVWHTLVISLVLDCKVSRTAGWFSKKASTHM